MPRRLITVSYTGLDAAGGVPRFNRDLHSAFNDRECRHFCWADHPYRHEIDSRGETEWGRARLLNEYLVGARLIRSDDVIVADGFWTSGLEHIPLAVSHSHGIWSHLTYEDVMAGRQPDMPLHHAAQVTFRQQWRSRLRKPMTAVSDFIAAQMRLQWNLDVDAVIGNGVDIELYRPNPSAGLNAACHGWRVGARPLILHGVNDRGNANKGWDHIELLRSQLDADVMSLDDAWHEYCTVTNTMWTKAQVLADATMFVHPSGYEGNSYMVAEALACGLPFVGYDVGLMWSLQGMSDRFGVIIDRKRRCPVETLNAVIRVLDCIQQLWGGSLWMRHSAREIAVQYASISMFNDSWRQYISDLEDRHAT